jgi:hypothetical protein
LPNIFIDQLEIFSPRISGGYITSTQEVHFFHILWSLIFFKFCSSNTLLICQISLYE